MEQVKSFFKEYWPFLLLSFLGFILKFSLLGERPLHHDESLHAQYGKYFANSFSTGFYKYDPMLHGPFLYHLQALWHWIAAPLSKAQVRFIPAFLGCLLSLSPLLFRNKLNKKQLFFIMLFLAISPTFTYWSRYLRHDYLVLLEITVGIFLYIARPKHWIILLGFVSGLHFSTKENFFVHLALLAGFVTTKDIITKKFELPKLKEVGIFALGFLLSSIPLYTGWFQYWPGFLDGAYRKSLSYWFNQHHVERIKGPFFYNSLIISIYEVWMAPTLLILTGLWITKQERKWRIIDLSFIFIILTISLLLPTRLPEFVTSFLKIKNSIDFFLFFTIIFAALRVTILLIKKQKIALAFSCYLFFSSLFTYSFLGEKVPWLSLYPIMAFAVLMTLLLRNLDKRYFYSLCVFLSLSIFKTIYINFISAGSEKELISQVHTTKQYEDIAIKIRDSLDKPVGSIKPRVLILEDNGWPLSWYLWGYGGVDYAASLTQQSNYDFIFDKFLDTDPSGLLSKTHNRELVSLRHYWWPHFSELTFKRWLALYFLNEPWSVSGDFRISLWRKKDGFFSE